MGPPLFEFTGVGVAVGDARLVDRVDLVVPDDGITVILGPSGAGKSTLLRLCNRLEVPTEGHVRCRGRDLAEIDPLRLRREVGMVFQRAALFAGSVRDNLRVADAEASTSRLESTLADVGLDGELLDRSADVLSGGEAQRACLARTLLTEPRALLVDEGTASLDPENQRRLERLIREQAQRGVGVIWVTHDIDQADRVGDRQVLMVAGRITSEQDAADYMKRWRDVG